MFLLSLLNFWRLINLLNYFSLFHRFGVKVGEIVLGWISFLKLMVDLLFIPNLKIRLRNTFCFKEMLLMRKPIFGIGKDLLVLEHRFLVVILRKN